MQEAKKIMEEKTHRYSISTLTGLKRKPHILQIEQVKTHTQTPTVREKTQTETHTEKKNMQIK